MHILISVFGCILSLFDAVDVLISKPVLLLTLACIRVVIKEFLGNKPTAISARLQKNCALSIIECQYFI